MAGLIRSIRDDPVIHQRGLLERRANQSLKAPFQPLTQKQTHFPFPVGASDDISLGRNPFRGKSPVKETSILVRVLSERVTTSPWVGTHFVAKAPSKRHRSSKPVQFTLMQRERRRSFDGEKDSLEQASTNSSPSFTPLFPSERVTTSPWVGTHFVAKAPSKSYRPSSPSRSRGLLGRLEIF
jgi:hypothetical protein